MKIIKQCATAEIVVMEKYIKIEKGYPEHDLSVEVKCNDGSKYEVYWSTRGKWIDVETGFEIMLNVEKWRYI